MCFNESLRIEPPVVISSNLIFSQDTKVLNGKYTIRKDHPMSVCIHDLHHNPLYWIEPEKFIPERFDPESKYHLQPDGNKRHPLAFTPFLGGKRVCIGKTFAEIVSKFVAPAILGKYEFEYQNKEQLTNKPIINVDTEYEPVIMVKLKRTHLF